MGSSETLFSLEVAVETLRVQSATVACRFPAVAFRLLDFPTLLVHHIEPSDTQRIKDSVFIDQELNGIPLQLQELKDHRGNFVVKKGKSCMFKMNLETLHSHLSNAPLYVMLVDTWPEVPKLVANCTVSLQEVIQNISEDVQNLGIEMPSVHGVRGSYKLNNLMGTEIGWIVLGLRLLSLGTSLMPHIPQAALVTRRSAEYTDKKDVNASVGAESKNSGKQTRDGANIESNDIIVEDLEVATTGHIIPDDIKPTLNVAISTTEKVEIKARAPLKNSGTQTSKSKKIVHQKTRSQRFPKQEASRMPGADLIVSNTHCPPPLFFNADLPVPDEENANIPETYQHVDNMPVGIDTAPENELNDTSVSNMTSTESEITSVNSREQYIETHYRYQSLASGERQTSKSVRKTHRKETSRHHLNSAPNIKPSGDTGQSQRNPQPSLISHSQMPILSALLQELSLLHGNHLPSVSSHPPGDSVSDKRPPPTPASPRGKENLVADFSNPKKQSPYRHKHEDCARTPRGIPSKKSWLRKEPKPSKPIQKMPKSKLRFGMTNTQKLRLQKNNPELLKHLQEQEAKVKTYRQSLTERVQRRKEEEAAIMRSTASDLDVSTEISHHQDKDHRTRMPDRPEVQPQDETSSTDQAEEINKKRKPIPTPRGGATFKWDNVNRMQQQEYSQETSESNSNVKDAVSSTDLSERSVKSGRSIDVYLPTPSFEDSLDIDGTQSLLETPPKHDTNSQTKLSKKTVAIPGFPSLESTLDEDTGKSSFQYSDQFDTAKLLESTGEQELHQLSQSSYGRSADSFKDHSSKVSHSSRSFKSSRSSGVTDIDSPELEESRKAHVVQQPGRLQPGFPMPKPLLSTKSPVPLAVRRSSRPSLQFQIPVNVLEMHDENPSPPGTPPTPKPRLNVQRVSSIRSSSSQRGENFSTSEFSSKDSEGRFNGSKSHDSKKDYSIDGYSDEFDSSDSN